MSNVRSCACRWIAFTPAAGGLSTSPLAQLMDAASDGRLPQPAPMPEGVGSVASSLARRARRAGRSGDDPGASSDPMHVDEDTPADETLRDAVTRLAAQ